MKRNAGLHVNLLYEQRDKQAEESPSAAAVENIDRDRVFQIPIYFFLEISWQINVEYHHRMFKKVAGE
jgi:hypothetical protein